MIKRGNREGMFMLCSEESNDLESTVTLAMNFDLIQLFFFFFTEIHDTGTHVCHILV